MSGQKEGRLPPGASLLWGGPRMPRRGRKPALTLEQIASAAIDLADRDGIGALSMQRLAERLGKGTMSLYRYVDTKDDLIAVMLDLAVGPPGTESVDPQDWRSALTSWARETRDIFQAHPWTLPLVTTKRMMGPNETARLEAALQAISGLGLTAAQMMDAVLLVNGYVRGATQPDIDTPSDEPDGVEPHTSSTPEVVAGPDFGELYPILTGVHAELGSVGAATVRERRAQAERSFEFGLRCILDGIEAQLELSVPRSGNSVALRMRSE